MTKSPKMGMRLLSLALCLMCVLCLVRPTRATEAEEKPTTLTTVVRNGARYQADVIGQMEDGTTVTVLEETREFYLVDCYDMNGYIAKTQIGKNADGEYYVNCQEDSEETRTFTYEDYAEALIQRHSLIALAEQQLGKPPFEMFDTNGMQLRAASPFAMTFPCGYSLTYLGYMPSCTAVPHGGYEVFMCRYVPGTGESVVLKLAAMLQEMKNERG